eukprot:TRINITY_DN1465_c0_g3_i1.p1 TRINITY_DN1465_c0_g3~~TRINITY_DN1465_c0_g3_i1.p1  ORF type:complete len:649 (+),score=252.61 TRINITY_DN1465_c0_g3_i1:131-1948(+)
MQFVALLGLAVVAQPYVALPGMGWVQGVVKPTPAEVDVEQYLGLRYTQAPVGNLRFNAPANPLPWGGVYDATKLRDTCPGSMCEYVNGTDSEDCLFLNVYTPVGARHRRHRLPVVVYIHGGGFSTGCSNEFPTENWVAASVKRGEPVVAVSINYRLNFFGFLGSNELRGNDASASTGNFGIQDQRKALEWVNKYISRFGGNPYQVTISGESAGAASVNVHMVSEKSYKHCYTNGRLFHRAVAQSGLAAGFGYFDLSDSEQVYALTKAATGCNTADPVQCLRSAPASVFDAIRGSFPTGLFGPVVDGVELTQEPWKLMRDGKFANVPVLTGANRDEYSFLIAQNPLLLTDDADETAFSSLLSRVLPAGTEGEEKLAELKQLYSNESYTYPPVSEWGGRSYWWWAAMRALSDQFFNCPNQYGARALARGPVNRWGRRSWLPWRRSPVYQYFLTRPTQTRTVVPATGPGATTVPHAVDIAYFFNCSVVGPCLEMEPTATCEKKLTQPSCAFENVAEQNLADRMSRLMTRFATGRHPGYPFLRTSGSRYFDYSVGLDAAHEDGGRGFFPIVNNRKAQCKFWDGIDRPDNNSFRQHSIQLFLRLYLGLRY